MRRNKQPRVGRGTGPHPYRGVSVTHSPKKYGFLSAPASKAMWTGSQPRAPGLQQGGCKANPSNEKVGCLGEGVGATCVSVGSRGVQLFCVSVAQQLCQDSLPEKADHMRTPKCSSLKQRVWSPLRARGRGYVERCLLSLHRLRSGLRSHQKAGLVEEEPPPCSLMWPRQDAVPCSC
jgi:hypothetical protein